MRLEIRGRVFDIDSDDNSWRVAEVKKNKKGTEYLADHAYLSNIEGVADHLFQYSLRKADAETLKELGEIAWGLRMEIRKSFDL
jgi:hypothetical protein